MSINNNPLGKAKIPLITLFKDFSFNELDYNQSDIVAKEICFLATLEIISAIGFFILFSAGAYYFNPPPLLWAVSGGLSCLLTYKAFVEIKRFQHAIKWREQWQLQHTTYWRSK